MTEHEPTMTTIKVTPTQAAALRNAAEAYTQHRVMGYSDFGLDGAADFGPRTGFGASTVKALEKRGLVTTERRGLLVLYRITEAGRAALGATNG